jgi:hypothetical protein
MSENVVLVSEWTFGKPYMEGHLHVYEDVINMTLRVIVISAANYLLISN